MATFTNARYLSFVYQNTHFMCEVTERTKTLISFVDYNTKIESSFELVENGYMLSDQTVIPFDQIKFYNEVLRLPERHARKSIINNRLCDLLIAEFLSRRDFIALLLVNKHYAYTIGNGIHNQELYYIRYKNTYPSYYNEIKDEIRTSIDWRSLYFNTNLWERGSNEKLATQIYELKVRTYIHPNVIMYYSSTDIAKIFKTDELIKWILDDNGYRCRYIFGTYSSRFALSRDVIMYNNIKLTEYMFRKTYLQLDNRSLFCILTNGFTEILNIITENGSLITIDYSESETCITISITYVSRNFLYSSLFKHKSLKTLIYLNERFHLIPKERDIKIARENNQTEILEWFESLE